MARIAAAFERAPFEELGWDNALRTLAEATHSSHGQMLAIGARHLAFNWVSGASPEFHSLLEGFDGYRPEVNYRVAAAGQPFEMAWEEHYDAIRAAHTDEQYMDAMRCLDIEHGAQMVLTQQPGAFFGLAVLRSASDGRSSEADRQVFAEAGQHVLSALRTQNAIEHQGMLMMQGSLEAMRTPAILLDAAARVCHVSEAAAPLLGMRTLQIRSRTLHAGCPAMDRALQARIALALSGAETGPSDLWIRSDAGLLLVDVRALPRQEWHFGFTPRVIVTLRSPLATPDGTHHHLAQEELEHDARHLAEALGLSSAEAHVVALLSRGHSRQEIAGLRGVSTQTVTTQLRNIFLKCGVRRESELATVARALTEIARH
ncbi:helix-turn-helix transcriptional regulator [Novosphingobium album (ex Hu et al. 2023)]|uniref:Helix-turn-helix transcriptional regulator n=1 Tax=Novosphingobium album (ex Hu et al. 2023) TaxID=2930093 RepID=A0ABT0AZT2_9SPHN|nr:helix-turn-helix transcriptional regulator [Novosphingobium album (ex Hu et al. 2023)]MCJ2178209.1 helix-turn-helix transcriptional regulator [Novosphingobium album (ex Hu et al. 2023)]